ncbi:hypothetical protein [Amycolatopsis jejuensis]|uniref:hypothetical protein n=1 Tax=Amycolatopsis jejuensis TaxID=330084 RepID=UPI0006904A03|nr:hypothetical protein [Amycolatopsis jejuensis]
MSKRRIEARQRRHHKEFRIAEPGVGADERARLRELIDHVSPTGPELSESDLAEAATALWRARRKLAGAEDRLARQAGRFLSASQDALDAAGVLVQDHDRIPFGSGMALEVLLFQDEPELDVERVVETVRPSIYLTGRRIQMGQVIVGRPAAHGNGEADA